MHCVIQHLLWLTHRFREQVESSHRRSHIQSCVLYKAIGGRPARCDSRDRYRDSRCSSSRGYGRPSHGSDACGSRPATADNNEWPTGNGATIDASAAASNSATVDISAAVSNSAVSAGNTALEARSTGAAVCSNRHHWSSRNSLRRNRLAMARYRPRNCSNCLLHRSKARTHQGTIPTLQAVEFGAACFDRAWRPPGPRMSHTSDAGRRQSNVR